ncbi:MAG: MBL fold metallo-hydrolase [Candidatus Paceibacterota bacterium]|jgi:L-ascorbate metabolism protein UlaG (beta-lactamase superfamily)
MIITYHREGFVKVQQGDLTVAFNPVSREIDAKATRFGADLCLVSLNSPSFNGCETVTFGNKEPFIIDGPGEYEIDGIFVYGWPSEGADGQVNTVFTTEIEGIRLCHLGALANPTLDPQTIEDIGGVDILFVPIAGGPVLPPKEAAKLAASLEAKIIIPVMFENGAGEEALKTFAKEIGGNTDNRVDKLTIKKKEVESQEGEVIIIQAS